MGWASIIEDVAKRFDADGLWSFPLPQDRSPLSPKAVAERVRMDAEEKATQLAIRAFLQNQDKIKKHKVSIGRLETKLEFANKGLSQLRQKLTEAAAANNRLGERVAEQGARFAQRLARDTFVPENANAQSLDNLLAKIDGFQEKQKLALGKEAQENFDAIKKYTLSEREIAAQEQKISSLTQRLQLVDEETLSVKNILAQVSERNRMLGNKVNTLQGWQMMEEWLSKNSNVRPKEDEGNSLNPKKRKPASSGFNPVIA